MDMQGQKQHVKTIEAGGFFGEVALVEHVNVRAADCIAKDRVKLLSMVSTRSSMQTPAVATVLLLRLYEREHTAGPILSINGKQLDC